MDDWKTSFHLGWPIFRCYVSLREGSCTRIILETSRIYSDWFAEIRIHESPPSSLQFAKSLPGLAPEYDTKHIKKKLSPFSKPTNTMKRHGKTTNCSEQSSLHLCLKCLCKVLKIFFAICMQAQALSHPDSTLASVGRFPSIPSRPSQGSIAVPWLVSTQGGKPEKKNEASVAFNLTWFWLPLFAGIMCNWQIKQKWAIMLVLLKWCWVNGTEFSVQSWILYFTSILRNSIMVNIFENFLGGSPYLVSQYRVNTESMPTQKATCNTVGMEELFHSAKWEALECFPVEAHKVVYLSI